MEIERLKELLHYDPATGVFRWRVTRSRGAHAGGIAGATDADGYTIIKIMGKPHRASRLAIFYVTGEWPPEQVDHQNRVRSDDRFDNLLPCNHSENQQNAGLRRDNKSGFQGVSWNKRAKKWSAERELRGRRMHLGYHGTPEAAHAAYIQSKAMEA